MDRGERQHGFTLIAVLVAMVLLSLATQGAVFVVSQQAQREREHELIHIGGEYVRAIRSYYESSPGTVKRYPDRLDELVEDHRFIGIKRHLRALYGDPVEGNGPLVVLTRSDGTIEGVASRSARAPIAAARVHTPDFDLDAARRYSDWHFVFRPNAGGAQ